MTIHPSADREDPGERRAFRFGRRALLLSFAVWSVVALFFTVFLAVGSEERMGLRSVAETAVYCLLTSWAWALLTPVVFRVAYWWAIDRPGWAARGVAVLALGFAMSVLAILVGDAVRMGVLGHPLVGGEGFSLADVLLRRWFTGEVMTYTAVLAAGLAWDYFTRYRERLEETVRLAAEKARVEADGARLERELAEARIELLRSQLDPHFLFNTLNGVAALIDEDPRAVRRMLALLSELMASALQPPGEAELPLADELARTGRYLELLEIRYQGRLETRVRAEDGVGEALVPGSILQPLVENAVKHGVGRAGGHGRIEVRARRDDESLVVGVWDSGAGDGVGAPDPGSGGWGIGLRSTRSRLEELYGPWQSLALRPAPGGGTLAEIVVPYHTRADLREAEGSSVHGVA